MIWIKTDIGLFQLTKSIHFKYHSDGDELYVDNIKSSDRPYYTKEQNKIMKLVYEYIDNQLLAINEPANIIDVEKIRQECK